MDKKIVYADNAATTRTSESVIAAMMPYFTTHYGNPSSIYSLGFETKKAVDTARKQVAAALGAQENEIYFTSCGSESDNWALKGSVLHGKKHIVTSAYEHHAVLNTAEALVKQGCEVTFVKPTSEGIITPESVKAAIRPDTAVVSIMYVNNEIGTVNPIAEIGAVCREAGVPFHTDAVQAVGHVPVDVVKDNIDMLSLSGHKFNAPKGIGAMYIRRGTRLEPFMNGGQQERGRRAGTENVAYIAGLGAAITEAVQSLPEETKRLTAMRDRLIDGLLALPKTRLNGSRERRVSGNVNISFQGIEGESLLLWMDMAGICASSGSACTSQSLDPSHVLLSIGLPAETAHGSLRITLGRYNTAEDVDYILAVVPPIVEKLRKMSPIWNG